MTVKAPEKLKDSGVEWLGRVPADWKVKKLKHISRLSREKNSNKPTGEMLSVSGYRGVEIKNYEFEEQKRTDAELADYRVVRPGQLVVNTMWLNYAGLGVSNITGYVSPAYRSYIIEDNDINLEFLNYLVRSNIYVEGYTKYLQGIRPNSLQMKNEVFNSWPIIIPPGEVQQRIVNFLDEETAKIDNLITKQERLLELLEEKRRATITHAVTRGLDPNVELEESNISWLGKVPSNWTLQKLSRVSSRFENGTTATQLDSETDFPVTRIQTISSGKIDLSKVGFISRLDATDKYLLRKGDILFSNINSISMIGNVAKVDVDGLYHGMNLLRIAPTKIRPGFLMYLLMSSKYQQYFSSIAKPAINQASIPASGIKATQIALPTDHEQMRIESFLDEETIKIDNLKEKIHKQVSLLKDRRTSLISHTVTGKIKV